MHSVIPRELNSDPLRTIRWFERHYPNELDLYGMATIRPLATFR